ncbi:MAG: hypothetical protein ACI906_001793 [Candidatus Latescibacterota bacterium]|jgi:hypothetical protein
MSEIHIQKNGTGTMSKNSGAGGRAWAWGITAVYTTFALLAVSFVIFASGQSVDLVSSDYYQRALEHQEDMESMRRAGALPPDIAWSVRALPNGLLCSFPIEKIGAPSGSIHLYRPADAGLDHRFEIGVETGEQRLVTGPLKTGLWRVRFLWAVEGIEYFQEIALEVE